MTFIYNLLKEIFFFYHEIAIYLVFGFFVAGVLHVFFPESMIQKHLGASSLGSVIKATLFGIPLPLCSCGVVPVATSLKKSGASKGSIVSFLVSTPQIGADSFLVTYSLIGWVFAVFRIVASAITAFISGVLVNLFSQKDKEEASSTQALQETMGERLKSIFFYVEYNLLGSLANALLLGIVIAGLISALIPISFFERYLGNDFLSMILMMAIGIPLYVCASASTPIAASLLMKGISPGAALVFLLTGPATNAVNIATVSKIVGKKSTAAYLATIAGVSLLLGFLLNKLSALTGLAVIHEHHHSMLPEWLNTIGSISLFAMLSIYYYRIKLYPKLRKKRTMSNTYTLHVKNMSCMNCVKHVTHAIESVEGTSDIMIDLDKGTASFVLLNTDLLDTVKKKIEEAGYPVE